MKFICLFFFLIFVKSEAIFLKDDKYVQDGGQCGEFFKSGDLEKDFKSNSNHLKGDQNDLNLIDECVNGDNGKYCITTSTNYIIGRCLSNVCANEDFNIIFNLTFNENFCYAKQNLEYSMGAMFLIFILVFLVCISTLFGKNYERISIFSVIKNMSNLFDIKNSQNLTCINGLRVLSLLWVILYHELISASLSNFKNYLGYQKCVPQSWYLSVDMQLFWLSPLILVPLKLYPKVILKCIYGLIFIGVFANFYVSYHYELPYETHQSQDPNYYEYTFFYYISTHTRYNPYLLGILCGYCIFLQKKSVNKLNKRNKCILISISIFLITFCYYSLIFLLGKPKNILLNSLYNAGIRIVFSLGISLLTILCVTENAGTINNFLSLKIFGVLSKLSFCMFMSHNIVLYVRRNANYTNYDISEHNIRQTVVVRELNEEVQKRKEMQQQMKHELLTEETATLSKTIKVQEVSPDEELEYQQSSLAELELELENARKELESTATALMHQDELQNTLDEAQTEVQKLQEKSESAGEAGRNPMLREHKKRVVRQIAKKQRKGANMKSELDVLKERCEKADINQQKIQLERDDALANVKILKDMLEKAICASQNYINDRLNLLKKFEKFIEKFDGLGGYVYGVKNKLDTVEADKNRLKLELENGQLSRLQEKYDRAQMQLDRSKELEEKTKEELGRMAMDYEKAQVEIRRLQSENEKMQAENEKLQYDLERSHSQAGYEKSQEEIAHLQVEVEKAYKKHDKLQNEFRKVVGEYDALGETTTKTRSVDRNRRQYDRVDRIKEGNDRLKFEVYRLRGLLDKMLKDLDRTRKQLAAVEGTRNTSEQEKERSLEMDRLKEDLQRTLNSNQQLEIKLHEVSMQLDLARDEVAKLSGEQDKQRHEWERDVTECGKLRDCHEKLTTEKLEKDNKKLRMDLTQALAQCKVRNDRRLEFERLKIQLKTSLQAKDATEKEAGRLAQELEKSQIQLANALEINETTKIEFQRITNELAIMNETIENGKLDLNTLEQERDVLGAETQHVRSGMDAQRETMDQRTDALQQELAQALKEPDKLANILDKQDPRSTMDMLEECDKEITKLQQQFHFIQKERDAYIQRADTAEKLLQESEGRSDSELKQCYKIIKEETMRADQAEKKAKKLMKEYFLLSKLQASIQKAEDGEAAAVDEAKRSAAEMETLSQMLEFSQELQKNKAMHLPELIQALKKAEELFKK